MSSSSSSKICNFIYSILKEILSDDDGYSLCVELFDNDYSEEDISEFVMRQFLKNIHNNYSFEINKIQNIVVEEDNIIVEDKPVAIEDNIVIEDTIIVKDKPVVENTIVVEDKNQKSKLPRNLKKKMIMIWKVILIISNLIPIIPNNKKSPYLNLTLTHTSPMVKLGRSLLSILRYLLLVLAERKQKYIN
jgi:hypothetical protein